MWKNSEKTDIVKFLYSGSKTPEILILRQLKKIVPPESESPTKMASRRGSSSTVVVYPDTMSPTISTSSVVKTPDPQSPAPSASLVETEKTQKTKKGSLTPPNQLMEKKSEWNTPMISCAAQI